MKPVMQTRYGDAGNCLTACIASLLELPIEAVPDFIEHDAGHGEYLEVFNGFLSQFGLQALTLFLEHLDVQWKPSGYHLIYGYTAEGTKHAVVGFQGTVVHNPSLAGASLANIESYTVFVCNLTESLRT